MKAKKIIIVLCSVLVCNFAIAGVVKELSLGEALKAVELKNNEVLEEKFETQKAELDIDLVNANFRPKFDITTGIGPINKAYGNALNSQTSEVTEIKNWRALYLISVRGGYPLYNWGQKNDYLEAARLNVGVNQNKVQIKKNELKYKLKEIYYGNLLAANTLDFIKESLKEVDDVIKKVKKNKDDLYRLKILKNLMLTKQHEVLSSYNISLDGLKYYIGEYDSQDTYRPKEAWLELEERELQPLEFYLDLMKTDKPELKQLRDGILAKRRLAKATQKSSYPGLGLLLKYDYSYTSARDPQKSVYAYDPYNENSLVLGIGFRWNLDFGITKTEGAKFNVDALQLEAKQKTALTGLGLLVKKNWEEVKSLEARLEASQKALKFAKKLLSRSLIGGAMGLINGKEVVESYQARILTFKDYFQTVYEYNMAWAKLGHSVGVEIDPILIKE